MKTCRHCGETKEIELFPFAKQNKDGRAGHCRECDKMRKRASVARIKEADPEAWSQRNREYSAAHKERHPERVRQQARAHDIKRKFGITIDDYEKMLTDQGGMCATCSFRPLDKRLAIDHDRRCCPGNKSCGGCIGALLCSNCNTSLGLLKEDENTLANLLDYIRRYK